MNPSRNRVSLLGVLTQNPVSKPVGQTTLTTIEIETQRNYNHKGQDKEEIAVVQVDFFGKTAEAIAKYCRAGSLVDVEARLKLDSWQKDGKTYTKLKCVGDTIQFISGNAREGSQTAPREEKAQTPLTDRRTPVAPAVASAVAAPEDDGDDIPFLQIPPARIQFAILGFSGNKLK